MVILTIVFIIQAFVEKLRQGEFCLAEGEEKQFKSKTSVCAGIMVGENLCPCVVSRGWDALDVAGSGLCLGLWVESMPECVIIPYSTKVAVLPCWRHHNNLAPLQKLELVLHYCCLYCCFFHLHRYYNLCQCHWGQSWSQSKSYWLAFYKLFGRMLAKIWNHRFIDINILLWRPTSKDSFINLIIKWYNLHHFVRSFIGLIVSKV